MGGRVGCVRERFIDVPHHHHRNHPKLWRQSNEAVSAFFNRQGATARRREIITRRKRETHLTLRGGHLVDLGKGFTTLFKKR